MYIDIYMYIYICISICIILPQSIGSWGSKNLDSSPHFVIVNYDQHFFLEKNGYFGDVRW